jgi:hypothetical protein
MKQLFGKSWIAGAMLLTVTLAAIAPQAEAKGWEQVKTERSDAKTVMRETEIEIKAASGTLLVVTNHQVQIKVFTILGRLVSAETLPAGKSQLTLPAHGVYIVKVGDLTCKVAV